MEPLSRQLGRRIKALRLGCNASQLSLSERAGVSVSFLSMIERGRRLPHISTLARLADALGVPLFELFRFELAARVKASEPQAA
jgi:transcriptional regulator with XRE-family HTH domain